MLLLDHVIEQGVNFEFKFFSKEAFNCPVEFAYIFVFSQIETLDGSVDLLIFC